jgi:eukaryotic-like serine/threonine-protein kinase
MSQPPRQARSVRFGSFEVSYPSRELRRNGARTKLPGQPFDILAILLEHAGDVVTREELRQRLWPSDTFVDFEHGMNNAVKKLRTALGDSAERPLYIETLPRVGYRFIAPIETPNGASIDTRERRRKRWKVIVGPAAAVVVVALVAGSYFYFHRTPKLTEKDSIVLADFTNTTGDSVFDGTLREGLSVQLEQTPYVQLVSDDRVAQTLRLMEKPVDTRLTPAIAREICQRTNATTEIDGSIAALGNQYVLGLNAVNCASGETLAREQVTADGKETVLPALSRAASALRSKLGESRASLRTYDVPLEQATTSSLEALQAYSQGMQASWKGDFPSAISSFQRAVELDPSFAMAYGFLGTYYFEVGDGDLSAKNIKKAYSLRDRASEYERVALSGAYNLFVTGDFEKSAQFFKELTTSYPRDPSPWTGLGMATSLLGRYDQARAAFQKAAQLNPSPLTYGSLSFVYLNLNRLEEVRATIQQARAMRIEPAGASWMLYTLAFLKNDQAEMARQVAHPWTDTPPGTWEAAQGDTAAYYGHLARARDWSQRAIAAAMSARSKDLADGYEADSALREDLFGNFAKARNEAKEGSALSTNADVQGEAALALAISGDPGDAAKLAHDLNQQDPEYSLSLYFYLPAIHAAMALGQGDAREAEESLTPAATYELAYPSVAVPWIYTMMPVYLRGEAYLAEHQGTEAAAEFQKILDHRGLVKNSPIGALARLGLSRAFALSGDTLKAKTAYQDFLTLWKEADPDIPVLKQAQAEYAKLM